jgi:hypothetical protein
MKPSKPPEIPRRHFLRSAACLAAGSSIASADLQTPAAESEDQLESGALLEKPRRVPVVADVDVCVVGGSCTGVFAAVAAARLGAKVAIVEWNGFFGGVATASMVNVWHSLKDVKGEKQIIAGLTAEMIERLDKRGAIIFRGSASKGVEFNCEEMKIELDRLVTEAGIRPFLHTMLVAPHVRDGKMEAAIIEDKTGRRAIRARYFVDATGDADVVHRLGLPVYKRENLQPPTLCAILRGLSEIRQKHKTFNVNRVIFDKQYPDALEKGFSWSAVVPGGDDETMLAGTRVFGADCSDADQLTKAEIEGRRQVRAICDILREHFMDGKGVPLLTLAAKIGIRETRHARCLHQLTVDEILSGKRFPDAIGNGSYRIDVHSARGPGVKFRYLEDAAFYQIPYSSLVPPGAGNVLVAGRSIDADEEAFGAVRVMVNCNQMGQAAGVASYLALQEETSVAGVDRKKLRGTLEAQGALIL